MADIISREIEKSITGYCLECQEKNPVTIADCLMRLEKVRLHGPEHHYLVAASILTAYGNQYGKDKKDLLSKAFTRTKIIPAASCALYGACGAMLGIGAAIGIIVNANPFLKKELQAVNKITLKVQREMSQYSGPRCCKRAAWISIEKAVEGMDDFLNLKLENSPILCTWQNGNKECQGKCCKYYLNKHIKC